jgi:hypothetical protein
MANPAVVFLAFASHHHLNRLVLPLQKRLHPKELQFWVNTRSGVYHCRGTQYYGKTKTGTYMAEAKAQAAGHRPAYGRRCGS